MALMTGEQYIESIKKINMQVYMFGKKIEDPTEDPILRPSLNSVRMTYDLAHSGRSSCVVPYSRSAFLGSTLFNSSSSLS